jgi:hypothetical protein
LRLGVFAVALVVACACSSSARTRKKLIEYGWDRPNTGYVREHIAEMEKIPFDGVVMTVQPKPGAGYPSAFGTCAWRKLKFKAEDWQHAIKATKFKRFTDNFLQLLVSPGDVDWFSPEWSNIAHNCGVLARLAKQGGCKGIMFDPEAYVTQIWHYNGLPEKWRKAHTFKEYQARVRECGKEWMRAMNAEYPDITILALYGPYEPLWASGGHFEKAPEDNLYGLMRDFYDGALEVATPGTTIVDGFESSYGYKTLEKFQSARKVMLVQSKALYSDPKAFEEHVRAGFGNWLDWCWKDSWSFTDFTKNYFPPDQLRQSLALALQESDGYVWVYTQTLRWWNELNAPQAYIDALALAKNGPVAEPIKSK